MWVGRQLKSHIDCDGGDPYHFGHSGNCGSRPAATGAHQGDSTKLDPSSGQS